MSRGRLAASIALAAALLPAATLLAQQTTPPAPAAPRPFTPPAIADTTLANGLRVVVVRRSDVPLVSVRLTVHAGAEADPEALPGVVEMTAALLPKGTTTRSAPAVARAVEALGGTIESGAGWDHADASVTVTTPNAAAATAILADVVRRPAFAAAELERQRQQTLDLLTVEMGEPGALSGHVATRLVYEGKPYAHPIAGTPASVPRIARADVVRAHRRIWRPDNATLAFAGDIAPADAYAIARRAFGDWPRPAAPLARDDAGPSVAASAGAGPPRRVVVVDMPDAGQAAVQIVRPAFSRLDPDYARAQLLNSVLGGGYSSRLNQEIRIRRGLSYGAGSLLEAHRGAGALIAGAQTKNESADEVVGLMLEELRRLGAEPVPGEELVPRKATLGGDHARQLETAEGLAAVVAALVAQQVALDWLARFPAEVNAVRAAELRELAARRLGADAAHVVVVGDAKLFLEALRKRFPSVEVIPIAELDLGSPTLRRRSAM